MKKKTKSPGKRGSSRKKNAALPKVPVRRAESPRPLSDSSVPAKTPRHSSVKILLVEDHQDTRVSIQRLLEFSGHQVSPAASAAQALEIASAQQFDLVVSDLGLPDQSGHELMAQLRSRHGLEGIALSGYDREDEIERSRQSGFRDHLTKPVSFEQLKDLITDFSRQKK